MRTMKIHPSELFLKNAEIYQLKEQLAASGNCKSCETLTKSVDAFKRNVTSKIGELMDCINSRHIDMKTFISDIIIEKPSVSRQLVFDELDETRIPNKNRETRKWLYEFPLDKEKLVVSFSDAAVFFILQKTKVFCSLVEIHCKLFLLRFQFSF